MSTTPPVYNPNDPTIYLPYTTNRVENYGQAPPLPTQYPCNYCEMENGSTLMVKTRDGTCERHRRDPTIRPPRQTYVQRFLHLIGMRPN